MLTQKLFHPIVHQLMIKTCIFNGFTNRSNLTLYLFFSGNTDIHNGNLKLILALLWSLIANYQLGASNFPPKKLMLEWLKVSKVLSLLDACFDLISSPSPSMKIQIMGKKITENLGFESQLRKVNFFWSFFCSFSNSP